MVDYSKDKKEQVTKEKQDFFNEKKIHFYSEKEKLLSKNLESDKELQKYSKLIKTFRPDVKCKHPATFTFYASAEKKYADAFYNIINFYPFDGTKEEILSWHLDSPVLDSALIRQFWPGTVGHIQLTGENYVDFYAGPESLSTREFNGKLRNGESALKIDPSKGNTVEFWLKLESGTVLDDKDTIFQIGTAPETLAENEEPDANFHVMISKGNGNVMPLMVTYQTKTVGPENLRLNTTGLIKDDFTDDQWHHYAIQIIEQSDNLRIKLYIDGEFHSTTNYDLTADLAAAGLSKMESIDSHMSGRIGKPFDGDPSTSIAGFIDEFRFFKGIRTAEQIAKFYDKRVYASTLDNSDYTERLGVRFSFNKAFEDVQSKDSLVLDFSGNDVTGRIINYVSTCRKTTSAIDLSSNTENKEHKEPVLDENNNQLITLFNELKEIGQSFDKNNNNTFHKYLPEWTRDTEKNVTNDNEFNQLLQILACEMDSIKMSVDSIRKLSTPSYVEAFHLTDPESKEQADISVYSECGTENLYLGCADSGIDYELVSGNEIDFSIKSFENLGLEKSRYPLLFLATPEEEVESIVSKITLEKSIYETRNLIYKCLYNTYSFVSNRKGTENSYKSILNTLAAGGEVVSTNIYGTDAELFINNLKTDNRIAELKSISFAENSEATLFLQSSDPAERTFIEASIEELEFTFEGSFIFPVRKDLTYDLTTSSIFGIREVSGVNNNLSTTDPDRASIQATIVKEDNIGNNAKFVLSSTSNLFSPIETPIIRNVYGEDLWNISVRVYKESDNKFLENTTETKYKINFSGRCFVGSEPLSSFEVVTEVDQVTFEGFYQCNKTVFIGAQRQNITGDLIQRSDVKVVDFNAFQMFLSDEELDQRAKNLEIESIYNFKNSRNLTNPSNNTNNIIFRMSPRSLVSLDTDNTVKIIDSSPSGASLIGFFGPRIGSKYNFKSTTFSNNLQNVIQAEFLPISVNLPIQNLHGQDGVSIKENDYNKFDIDSRPNLKILSFEKSMYRSISDEMVKFLGGLTSYNNLIGEPVNKYRKSYKGLDKLRSLFFEGVQNSNQFERYVQYYRWIDKAVGQFLSQLVPASLLSNTGLENVIESHALERNKYDHKLFKINTKDLFLSTNLLAINELLYDWEHGHYDPDENTNCLWQNERKIKNEEREPIRKVLTTVVTGSNGSINGEHFRNYALRRLVKPYVFDTDRQLDLQIGSNSRANKLDIFYKIINTGKEITLKKDDIYIFRECNDEIVPKKNRKYVAKTDTTGTAGYLDGDADLLLPFTMYSSSAGANFSNFKDNLTIANNHDDGRSLQGLWIRDHVGGNPHRRVKLGQFPADDSGYQKDRPEAYRITADENTMTIGSPTGQRSIFNRSLAGSPFYNIANIKTKVDDSSVLVQGNYRRDYEIVQTCGRNINNTYLVEFEGLNLTGSIRASNFIQDMRDYVVPWHDTGRSSDKIQGRIRREHVFVNKFSPLGSPEQSGWFGRDRASGEFSTYNTVNYRNAVVRDVYNLLSKERSEKFGIRSGSVDQGSIHKTNRNYKYFKDEFGSQRQADNYFVTHQIPQNDFGYSWITASATDTIYEFLEKNNNHPHQHNFNVSGSLNPNETLSFLKQGEHFVTSGRLSDEIEFFGPPPEQARYDYPSDHVGDVISFNNLNLYIVDPINLDTNTMGDEIPIIGGVEDSDTIGEIRTRAPSLNPYTVRNIRMFDSVHVMPLVGKAAPIVFHSIILNRQGPYGWPSWKQIRGNEHPIIRNHRKNNTMSIVFRKPALTFDPRPNVRHYSDLTGGVVHSFSREVKNFKEIMVSNRFRPTNYSIHLITRNDFDLVNALNEIDLLDNENTQLRYLKAWNYDNFFDSIGILDDGSRITREDLPTFSQRFTITNKLSMFANAQMQDEIRIKEKDFFDSPDLFKLNLMVERVEGEVNFPSVLRELNYVEKIYPREENTFTSQIRNREKFDFFGWKDKRESRNLFLSGNLSYENFRSYSRGAMTTSRKIFPEIVAETQEKEFNKSFYNLVDVVDLNHTGSQQVDPASFTHISSSRWVLDARKSFNLPPLNINNSWMNNNINFLSTRDQGTRGEGILQNDYSIFALGANFLHATPPWSPVYNRRIPQAFGKGVEYLAGEAKWDAGENHPIGPFYDTYEEFAEEARVVGQQYSIIPEFTISRFTEDLVNKFTEDRVGSIQELYEDIQNFLQVTGATYHTSSEEFEIGSKFYKTYSTSDFLKYFGDFKDNVKQNHNERLKPFRISFRCKAVKRFLPYRGFYPAERAVQLTEIFSRCYKNDKSYSYEVTGDHLMNGGSDLKIALEKKIDSSHAQAAKLLFGPGVLFNSIKAGIATDYPIFSSSVGIFEEDISSIAIKYDGDTMNSWFYVSDPDFATAVTGSLVNKTTDEGIPRLSGSVSKRVDFYDFLYPQELWNTTVYDNEPHPSASLFYGSADHFARIDRPSPFGTIDEEKAERYNAVDFKRSQDSFRFAMLPYSMAAQNFAASTVDFFLEGQKLQTIMSEPIEPFLTEKRTYKMNVVLSNIDTQMYDRHSAFGPPVDDGDPLITTYVPGTVIEGKKAGGSVFFSAAETGATFLGQTLTMKDHENLEKVYFFSSGITAARQATAIIDWAQLPTSYSGETITLTDIYDETKTFRFVEDVSAVASQGSIDLSSFASNTDSLDGETFTLTDNHTSLQRAATYRFIKDGAPTPAVASEGQISVNSTNLDGETFTLIDNESPQTTKTYRFIEDTTSSPTTGQKSTAFVEFEDASDIDQTLKSFNEDVPLAAIRLVTTAGKDFNFLFTDSDMDRQAEVELFFPQYNTQEANFVAPHPNKENSVGNAPIDNQVLEFTFIDDENGASGSTTTMEMIFVKEFLQLSPALNKNTTAGLWPKDSSGRYKIFLRKFPSSPTRMTSGEIMLQIEALLESQNFTSDVSVSSAFSRIKIYQPHNGHLGNTQVKLKSVSSVNKWFQSGNKNATTTIDAGDAGFDESVDGRWSDFYFGANSLQNGDLIHGTHPLAEASGPDGDIFVFMSGVSQSNVSTLGESLATQFAAAVNNLSSHVGQGSGITAQVNLGRTNKPTRVDLEQEEAGSSGDTTITFNSNMTSALTGHSNNGTPDKANFSGGQNSQSGTTTTYTSGQVLSAHSNQVAVALGNGSKTVNQIANEIEIAVESSGGHNNTIAVASQQSKANFTQSTAGASGDTTITISNATKLSKSNFANGSDGTSGTTYSTGEVLAGGNIAIPISGKTIDQIGEAAEDAIENNFGHSNNHNGSNRINSDWQTGTDVLKVTQERAGSSGDKPIAHSSGLNGKVTNFSGGANGVNYTNGSEIGTTGHIAVDLTGKSTANEFAVQLKSALAAYGNLAITAHTDDLPQGGDDRQILTMDDDGSEGNKPTQSSISNFITDFTDGQDQATVSNGSADSQGRIIVTTTAGDNSSTVVSNLRQAIESSAGHNGTITSAPFAMGSGQLVLLQQSATGSSGNNPITGTGTYFNQTSPVIISGFSGGEDRLTGANNTILSTSTAIESGSHGFLPYVPPFLDSWTQPYAEITFSPTRTGVHSMEEIIRGCTISYENGIEPAGNNQSTNLKHAMNISCAIDLRSHATLLRDNVSYTRQSEPDLIGNIMRETRDPLLDKPRWIIQTKWETPVLDFRNVAASALNLGSDIVEQVKDSPWQTRTQADYYTRREASSERYLTASAGMWHQRGAVQDSTNGYYMHIASPFDTQGDVEDLAKTLGFIKPTNINSDNPSETNAINDTARKLGVLSEEKEISEAIVVIPFFQIKDNADIELITLEDSVVQDSMRINQFEETRFLQVLNTRNSQEDIDRVIENHKNFIDDQRTPDGKHNVSYQMRMMEKYILPPHFDWLHNRDIEPHLQYFFQFRGTIKKDELAQLWQNLYPDTNRGIFRTQHSNPILFSDLKEEEGVKTVDTEFMSSYIDVEPIIQAKQVKSCMKDPYEFINNTIRWLVFKVKYRSPSSYNDLSLNSIHHKDTVIQKNGIQQRRFTEKKDEQTIFQFNWPYDYFSLIEMAEIEAKVDFYSTVDAISISQADDRPSSQPPPTRVLPPGVAEVSDVIEDVKEIQVAMLNDVVEKSLTSVTPATAIASNTALSALATAEISTATSTDRIENQTLHAPGDAVPSPDNMLIVQLGGGFSIVKGSEKIQINGQLLQPGQNQDYVIDNESGKITFTFSIEKNDKVLISYTRE